MLESVAERWPLATPTKPAGQHLSRRCSQMAILANPLSDRVHRSRVCLMYNAVHSVLLESVALSRSQLEPRKLKSVKCCIHFYLFDAGARSRQREGTWYDWRHWQGLRAILSSLDRLVELASQSLAIRLWFLVVFTAVPHATAKAPTSDRRLPYARWVPSPLSPLRQLDELFIRERNKVVGISGSEIARR